jgi:hypothetical protein
MDNAKIVQYVIYTDSGTLEGCYIQAPPESHINHMIEVDSVTAAAWTSFRANEARDGVELVPLPQAAPPDVLDYTTAVQSMLDAKPRERRYDGILSATTYATSTLPKFKAEGQACVEWRDAVWARCYELMADVESGKLARPSVDELLTMLPNLVWPE